MARFLAFSAAFLASILAASAQPAAPPVADKSPESPAGKVSSKAADPADAKAFIAFVTRPQASALWKATGLDR